MRTVGIAYWIDSFLSALLGEVDARPALDCFGALLGTDLTCKVAVGLGLHDFPHRVIVAVKHGRAGKGVGKEAHIRLGMRPGCRISFLFMLMELSLNGLLETALDNAHGIGTRIEIEAPQEGPALILVI